MEYKIAIKSFLKIFPSEQIINYMFSRNSCIKSQVIILINGCNSQLRMYECVIVLRDAFCKRLWSCCQIICVHPKTKFLVYSIGKYFSLKLLNFLYKFFISKMKELNIDLKMRTLYAALDRYLNSYNFFLLIFKFSELKFSKNS